MKLYSRQDKAVSIWLTFMCLAVVTMVFIGGLTRLTDSGLSMTEWKPITGLLPPMNSDEWHIEFNKYQQSPEYQKINYGMNLEEFKSIYWLEYIHRIAGRVTALLFILPLVFFIIAGNIRGKDIFTYIFIGVLLAGQGVMGWYMVKSGLADQPHVSHFRLAAHLILAMIIYSFLFWQKMKNSFDIMLVSEGVSAATSGKRKLMRLELIFCIVITLVLLQIFVGGMVAGLNAGLLYNTYPLMGDSFIPNELMEQKFALALLCDPVFVQFSHRILAIIVFVAVSILVYRCVKSKYTKLQEAASFVIFAVTLQVTLGILTLIYYVPLSYALAHQLGGIFLLSSLLWGLFLVKNA